MRSRRKRFGWAPSSGAVIGLGAVLLAGCGGTNAATEPAPSAPSTPPPASSAPSQPGGTASTPTQQAGGYITLSDYESNRAAYAGNSVVLFFNATWCPTCRAATENFERDQNAFPRGLTVVSVDYDSHTDLKRKYGITYQHTFVQITPNGDEIKKWSGSETVDEVARQVSG